MGKKWLIALGVLVALGFAASLAQSVSQRMWERRVWSCYAALGSGETPLKARFLLPPMCRGTAILISNLGAPDAEVLLQFRPPQTMWLSYLMRTVDYDTYVIEIRTRDGVTRARLHHGSD
jgi:hypothetical protein